MDAPRDTRKLAAGSRAHVSLIPNALTAVRLVCVPLVLWLAHGETVGRLVGALVVFVLAGISDWLDGYLARRWKSITAFGTFIDPITDKLLILGMLFVFSDQGLLPLWLVLVNLFREMAVTGVRQVKAAQGVLVGTNWMGKTKFVLQSALVAGILAYRILVVRGTDVPHGREIVFWAAFAVTAVSMAMVLNFLRWHARELLDGRRP